MRASAILVIALALTQAGASSHAQDRVMAGRAKALQCQACHGLDGMAMVPGTPNIAGQVREYLIKAMTEYKNGARKNELMSIVMANMSTEDIDDLAAYYAAIEITVKAPR